MHVAYLLFILLDYISILTKISSITNQHNILSIIADNSLILIFYILGKNLVSKSPDEMETQ